MPFPPLRARARAVVTVCLVRSGITHLDAAISKLPVADGKRALPAQLAFHLYDSLGFPVDVTTSLAEQRGWGVDAVGGGALCLCP